MDAKTSKIPAFECIPRDLKAIPRWVGWRFNRREDGTLSKVPQNANGNASAHEPKNWMSFTAWSFGMTGARSPTPPWRLPGLMALLIRKTWPSTDQASRIG